MASFPALPDLVELYCASGRKKFARPTLKQNYNDVQLVFRPGEELTIKITALSTGISFLKLRWNIDLPESALVCGDAWERTYGDVRWQHPDPAKIMPWYFSAFDGEKLHCFGVKVRPAAFALWTCDPCGITLWLDVRCGTEPVMLKQRELEVATVVGMSRATTRPRVAELHDFCRQMCTDALLPSHPVYGTNNWYYAYGQSSAAQLLQDAEYLAKLTVGLGNRPYLVIDDGWEFKYGNGYNGGPWNQAKPEYGDMRELADRIRQRDLHPGIWMRPLWNRDAPEQLRNLRNPEYLDPSLPEVLKLVENDVRMIVGQGYELIKHDFSTFDIFGKWGFEMSGFPAGGNWTFRCSGKTSAEIVTELYRTILAGAGQALILGCNTIGHLGAGLMHLARSGDDTSGMVWERSRKMGINTLAFRLPQHRAFFDVDPDCVGVTKAIDWKFNRQWGRLAAASGTSFFTSITPDILTAGEFVEAREFFRIAAAGGWMVEPLDWLNTPCPQRWNIAGQEVTFDWYGQEGTVPEFIC